MSLRELGIACAGGSVDDRKLVLVVDDHVDERAITQIVLEHFGYEVSTASSALEALRSARERKPDLIVMDIMMPDMDGVEAIERLSADPRTARIPVLAYTAYRDVYRDRLDAARFVGTLEKPAGPARLLSAVAQQIGVPEGGGKQEGWTP